MESYIISIEGDETEIWADNPIDAIYRAARMFEVSPEKVEIVKYPYDE